MARQIRILVLALAVTAADAQFNGLPQCAQTPFTSNLPADCNPYDVYCICRTKQWIDNLGPAVAGSCGSSDQAGRSISARFQSYGRLGSHPVAASAFATTICTDVGVPITLVGVGSKTTLTLPASVPPSSVSSSTDSAGGSDGISASPTIDTTASNPATSSMSSLSVPTDAGAMATVTVSGAGPSATLLPPAEAAQSTKIGLGVGLGLGVPVIAVAIAGLLVLLHKRKLYRQKNPIGVEKGYQGLIGISRDGKGRP